MDANKDETILAKWLSGEISTEEAGQFIDPKELESLQHKLDLTKRLDYPKKSGAELWDKMGDQIMSLPKHKTPQASVRLWPRMVAVAASVLILVGMFWFLQKSPTQLQVANGEKAKQAWEDGSVAQLNAGSQIDWNKDWDQLRSVRLDGEAFFSVSKGQPFVVSTSQGKVEVLGTRFNVSDRDGQLTVRCYEGKVKVSQDGEETILTAGVGVVYTKGKASPINVQGEQPHWLSGRAVFRKAALSQVFEELERQYDISIEVEANIIDRQFTGQFPDNNLTQALQLVCDPMRLRYEKQGDNIRIIE